MQNLLCISAAAAAMYMCDDIFNKHFIHRQTYRHTDNLSTCRRDFKIKKPNRSYDLIHTSYTCIQLMNDDDDNH